VTRRRTAILISGRGSNMAALLSNRPDAAGLDRARAAGIPTAIVDHRAFRGDRAAFEAAVNERLDAAGVEIVALAGFLRVLTEGFVARWQDRLVNIHPSLLPAFKGLDTHARALAAGVRIHGCTVHLVRAGVDEGPILAQAAVPVRDDDTEATLAARVLEQEHRIYPPALAALAAGRVRIEGGRAIVTGAEAPDAALANPLPVRAAPPTPSAD
jgi:formyltetrahydrofolate-dependent phosphoribosylglycinamide formyltransferase